MPEICIRYFSRLKSAKMPHYDKITHDVIDRQGHQVVKLARGNFNMPEHQVLKNHGRTEHITIPASVVPSTVYTEDSSFEFILATKDKD